MKNINQITMEFWCGVGSLKDLDDWAESELRENESPHPDVCELFGIPYEKAEEYLLSISKDLSGFTPLSEEGEVLAISLLNEYCRKFLNEEITPLKFCLLIQRLDGAFVDFRKISEKEYEYPPWLGDLWNSCDWCDETWTYQNSQHLIDEANKVLSTNNSKEKTEQIH